MNKKLVPVLMALILALMPACMLAEEEFDPSGFVKWYNDNYMWMSVDNGHWSSDPADQISDEDLAEILSMAVRAQSAGDNMPWYYVAVKDVNEQRNILGDMWCDPVDVATEGTVTVLLYSSDILSFEKTSVPEGSPPFAYIPWALYDVGISSGLLNVAAATKGYYTHFFGGINGEYAPADIENGKHQSLARYLNENDLHINGIGMAYHYGEEIPRDAMIPVLEDCIFITAIVIGKPIPDESVETWGSYHVRTENWKIWDGTVNENALTVSDMADEQTEEKVYDLADNEYVGTAKGMDGDVVVKITVEEGKITAIEVLQQNETVGIGDKAVAAVPAKIIEKQSAEVDGVTGATVTSDAIKAAVAEAMSQAGL